MKSKMARDVIIIAVMVIVAVGIVLYTKNNKSGKDEAGKAQVAQKAVPAANPHGGGMPPMAGGDEQNLFGQWLTIALSNADVQFNEEDKSSEFIATVNGTGIRRADFDKRLLLKLAVLTKSEMHGQKAEESEVTSDKKKEIEENLLEQMIEETFIQAEAVTREVAISDEQFEGAMNARKEQIGGDEKFQELLKSHGISEEQMRTNLRKEMTQQSLAKVVIPEMQKMMGGGGGHGAGMMGAPGVEGGSPHGSKGGGESAPHGGGMGGDGAASPHGTMGGEGTENPHGM